MQKSYQSMINSWLCVFGFVSMLSLPQNMSVIIYLRLSFGVSLIMQVTNCCGPTPVWHSRAQPHLGDVMECWGQIFIPLYNIYVLNVNLRLLKTIVRACFVRHVTMKWLWNNKISFRLLFLRGNKRDNNEQGTLITCITCLTLMEIKNNWWLL